MGMVLYNLPKVFKHSSISLDPINPKFSSFYRYKNET